MTPTRWTNLVVLALLTGVLGWGLAASSYESLRLPSYAPVTAGLMAVFELGLARVVSRKVHGTGGGQQMHPMQIARTAVLATAASSGGDLPGGSYGGCVSGGVT